MFPGALRAFNEVVRAGSIRKASETMGVSPSSVSRHVAVLERQMGTRLLERTSGGVTLTHAGHLVASYARGVVFDFDSLKEDLDDMRGSRRRLIRLATVESVVAAGPARAMAEFRQTFEDATFRLTMMPAPQVLDAVKKDVCDIGITMSPSPDPDIRTLAVLPEPIMLAVAAGHPFAGRASVTLAEVLGIDIAIPDESFGIRRIVDQAANGAGLAVRPTLVANTFAALRDHALWGGAATILPSRAILGHGGGATLVAVPIDEPPFRDGAIHVVAFAKRRLPRIVNIFADTLVRHVRAGGMPTADPADGGA